MKMWPLSVARVYDSIFLFFWLHCFAFCTINNNNTNTSITSFGDGRWYQPDPQFVDDSSSRLDEDIPSTNISPQLDRSSVSTNLYRPSEISSWSDTTSDVPKDALKSSTLADVDYPKKGSNRYKTEITTKTIFKPNEVIRTIQSDSNHYIPSSGNNFNDLDTEWETFFDRQLSEISFDDSDDGGVRPNIKEYRPDDGFNNDDEEQSENKKNRYHKSKIIATKKTLKNDGKQEEEILKFDPFEMFEFDMF